MADEILNRALLPGNDCFACGHENPHGLRIEVTYDGSSPGRLSGRFDPPPHATGFPGLTHGGALFSAMDCLATWVVVLLGPQDGRYWLLGSASVRYRKTAPAGEPLELAGWLIEDEGSEDSEVVLVRTKIRSGGGDLVAEGELQEVPVTPEKFKRVAGITEIPEAWRELFEEATDFRLRD